MGLEKDGRPPKQPNPYMDKMRQIQSDVDSKLATEFARFEDETGLCITGVTVHRVGTANGGSYIASVKTKIEL